MSKLKDRKAAFGRNLRNLRSKLRYRRRRVNMGIRNRWRLRRNRDLGYVIYPIRGPLPERNGPPRSFIERQLPLPPRPQSLQNVNYAFERFSQTPNVKGVVLLLKDVSGSLARLQNVRAAIERLKQSGKHVIVYTPALTLSHYFVACAADRIVAPPSAEFSVMGLQADGMYFKDALGQIGVQADLVRISPFKTAGNRFGESTMTEQEREQLSWLLDEQYDLLTSAVAADRKLTQDAVKGLIDKAPFSIDDAVRAGLVDAEAYDDEIADLIGRWDGMKVDEDGIRPKATLTHLGHAWKKMPERVERIHKKHIAVISVSGPIVMTNPGSPIPFQEGPNVASEASLTPLLRRFEKDDSAAALLVYVNSPGGSALASDLIWRQIDRIRKTKPVLVYMGGVAASGGYYIAAAGQHIMAQQATITGSIGVIMQRVSLSDLLEKLHISQVTLKRGENVGLYTDSKPLTEAEYELLRGRIVDVYDQFKRVVASGRDLPFESLDPICEGRVWTGRQAQQHGLIDSFGDFEAAVDKLKQMADLPTNDGVYVPVRSYYSRSTSYVVPPAQDFEALPAADPESLAGTLLQLIGASNIAAWNGQPLYMMPHTIRFH